MNLSGASKAIKEVAVEAKEGLGLNLKTAGGLVGAVAAGYVLEQTRYTGLFSGFSMDFCMPTSKYENYGDEMDMFNGLDSISGDGTKYKEANKFLQSIAIEHRWKAIIACTILLEKPTSVALGGMTGADKAQFRALYNKEEEAEKAVISQTSLFATVYDMTPEEKKDEIVKNCLASLATYIRIVNDVPELHFELDHLRGKFKDAIEEAISKSSTHVGLSAHYKNIRPEALDNIKSLAAEVRMKDEVAGYLPMMTEAEALSRSDKDKAKMDKSREFWPKCFKRVNVSRAKVVALMSLQYRNMLFPIQKDWVEKYNGRPFKAKCPSSVNASTKTIWESTMSKFKEDKKFHRSQDVRGIFNMESNYFGGNIKKSGKTDVPKAPIPAPTATAGTNTNNPITSPDDSSKKEKESDDLGIGGLM